MLPLRRDVLYVAAFLPTAFVVGLNAPRMTSLANPDPAMIAMWLIGCVVLVALIVGFVRYQRDNSPATLRPLVQRAHAEGLRLLDENFDMLVPNGCDRETKRLLIQQIEGAVVVSKETWHDTWHVYTIWPTGRVKREIFGPSLTRADQAWLNQPLTAKRLSYLIQALQSTYSPRRRVSADA